MQSSTESILPPARYARFCIALPDYAITGVRVTCLHISMHGFPGCRPYNLVQMPRFLINPVRSVSDLEAIVLLFSAYASSLTVDLAYQDFSRELADMPGKYAPPAGELLLARDARNGEALGCVGLRPLQQDGCCEMKRLYVAPQSRGIALGKALVSAVIQEATRIGYREFAWTRCQPWSRP